MFNSIRKTHPLSYEEFTNSPSYVIMAVDTSGDAVKNVPLPPLVDPRVKCQSVGATELLKNGVRPGNIKIGSPLNDGLKAMEMLRKIVSDAEYRAAVEKSIAELNIPEPTQEPNQETSKTN